MLENPVNPTMQTIVQQLNASGLSVSTPQQAYEVIFNPKRNGLTDSQMAPFQRALDCNGAGDYGDGEASDLSETPLRIGEG